MDTSSFRESHRANPPLALLLAMALATSSSAAQNLPDAGQLLQQQRAPTPAPAQTHGPQIESDNSAPIASGGMQVALTALSIDGNTVFTEAQLLAVLGDYAGKQYDLAQLQALADRLSQHYREAGYPFARALLPAQRSADGHLRISIVEGRYGAIEARSDNENFSQRATAYLNALNAGALIEGSSLERTALLLEDLPGIAITSTMRPGQAVGTGDLVVEVSREESLRASFALDNHGNRYSGQHRVSGALNWASPFLFGDQLQVQAIVGQEALRVGAIDYSLPIGTGGLRANASYAHTQYELGEEFAALGASGRARIASTGLAYPLLRSQRINLSARLSYQHKDLEDRYRSVGNTEHKHSHVMPLSVVFSARDALAGGGLTYGQVTWTHGQLHLAESVKPFDDLAARTHGRFDKLNVDLTRLQQLSPALSLQLSVSAQWAADNLDSSESFGLGGSGGVRAYPTGEAFGDEGWLGQVELRYALGAWSPYAFFDTGSIRVNAKPNINVAHRSEDRSGAGFGLRWFTQDWRLEAALAWRTSSDAPTSDTRDPQPRPWLNFSRHF